MNKYLTILILLICTSQSPCSHVVGVNVAREIVGFNESALQESGHGPFANDHEFEKIYCKSWLAQLNHLLIRQQNMIRWHPIQWPNESDCAFKRRKKDFQNAKKRINDKKGSLWQELSKTYKKCGVFYSRDILYKHNIEFAHKEKTACLHCAMDKKYGQESEQDIKRAREWQQVAEQMEYEALN